MKTSAPPFCLYTRTRNKDYVSKRVVRKKVHERISAGINRTKVARSGHKSPCFVIIIGHGMPKMLKVCQETVMCANLMAMEVRNVFGSVYKKWVFSRMNDLSLFYIIKNGPRNQVIVV